MKELSDGKRRGRNDPCWCGSGLKYKKCHLASDKASSGKKSSALKGSWPTSSSKPHAEHSSLIKTPEQIEGIRKAGRMNREILDLLEGEIREGISANSLDKFVYDYTLSKGGAPAPLNYKGFPKSICTSVNEVVCHGIPDERILKSGDILNVDVTTILDGFYGDSSRMYYIGEPDTAARRLVDVTRECLEIGIEQVKPGNFVGDIGHAIQAYAEKNGYSVVRDFVGHGTGIRFHEEPQIPHFGRKGNGPPLLPGMVFTIEPMINQGNWPVRILDDGWTAVTKDGKLSAQFEHTILVTPQGVEVITA